MKSKLDHPHKLPIHSNSTRLQTNISDKQFKSKLTIYIIIWSCTSIFIHILCGGSLHERRAMNPWQQYSNQMERKRKTNKMTIWLYRRTNCHPRVVGRLFNLFLFFLANSLSSSMPTPLPSPLQIQELQKANEVHSLTLSAKRALLLSIKLIMTKLTDGK